MKILRWIFIVIAVLIVAVIVAGYASPSKVVVKTDGNVFLPAEKVFHFVAGFVDREAWDPWIKSDTAARLTFDLKPGYTGSRYIWEGPRLGKGVMEVDSVVPGSYLVNMVSFSRGAPVTEEWTFTPSGDGTDFTWSITMTSRSPVGRLMNSLMKGMILKTIESGKEELMAYLGTHGVTISNLSDIRTEEYPSFGALVCKATSTLDALPALFAEKYGLIMAVMEEEKLQPQGSPFAIYEGYDTITGRVNVIAGIPVSEGATKKGEVTPMMFTAFTALEGLHTGPYDELHISYGKLRDYAVENNIGLKNEAWEIYINDPQETADPSQLQTLILMPVSK